MYCSAGRQSTTKNLTPSWKRKILPITKILKSCTLWQECTQSNYILVVIPKFHKPSSNGLLAIRKPCFENSMLLLSDDQQHFHSDFSLIHKLTDQKRSQSAIRSTVISPLLLINSTVVDTVTCSNKTRRLWSSNLTIHFY